MAGQNKETIDFITATMHELKTSLTAIIASAELLANELQVDDKNVQERLVQSIIRSAHTMDERLSPFSEMARLLTGSFRFQPEYVKMGQVTNSVAEQLYPITQSKRQSLALEVPDFLPSVKADKHYLEQILLNLLTNASKFTPEGGKIKVRAGQNGDSLVVEVSDTGVGIPVEEQEQVFQPYYRVMATRGTKPTGSGLGLAITKFLFELHGGKIWLESTVGQGSSFFFSLPLYQDKNKR